MIEAAELVKKAIADGLTLNPDGERLIVTGDAAARSRWRESLIANKTRVLRLLNDAQGTALPCWRMSFTDREPVDVTFSPPVDRAEVLRWHPEAVDARPVDRCRSCVHHRRPGQSDVGYCSHRTDLPPTAYALLRRLPDDLGAWCADFDPSEARQ